MSTQVATRIDDKDAELFRETTRLLGTTPADAMRIFIAAFNTHGGFPFEIRLTEPVVEPLSSEEDALDYSNHLAMRMISDAR